MQRPNILILYTDQQRFDALGANGNPDIRTPHLDRLARQGLNFDHCFVQHPLCMPSRASLLSGQYPSQLGITHMGVPFPPDVPILPAYLAPFGYSCANIGKLHFLPHANRDHREIHPSYGFDHLEISDEPGCYEDAYRAWVRAKAPDQLEHISLRLPPAAAVWQQNMGGRDGIEHPVLPAPCTKAFPGRSDVTHSAFVAEQTIEYLGARRAGEPFLCIAGFYSPHEPWVVPQEFLDLYDPAQLQIPDFPPELDAKRTGALSDQGLRLARQGYYAAISEVDFYVGQIMEALRQNGQDENTIVVFTADHGEYLGDFGRWNKGFPGEDCVSRVPLLVRWPAGFERAGATISGIVEAVDIVPSLLGWAGIPAPAALQGTPLPTDAAAPGKDSALMETTEGKTLRTARYRYIARRDGREALFDLEQKWGEYFDVAPQAEYAELLSQARGELVQRCLQVERPLPRVWPY